MIIEIIGHCVIGEDYRTTEMYPLKHTILSTNESLF